MSKIVILGAGISNQIASSHLLRKLSEKHEVLVVSQKNYYQWIRSIIWVGVGKIVV